MPYNPRETQVIRSEEIAWSKQQESSPTGGLERGVRPDIMILEGWLETSSPPRGASKAYTDEPQEAGGGRGGGEESGGGRGGRGTEINEKKRKRLEERKVTVIIGELGFSSDLNPQKTVERKQRKYAPLIEELIKEGWNVDPTVRVITVGVRATVPTRNIGVLDDLGIKDKTSQQKVQASMAHIAAAHLNRIVPQYRRLCGRINKPIKKNRAGIG